MKYDFDEVISRKGTHSIKWDSAETADILPMWIADMDFKVFPAVTDALSRISDQGHFGYNTVPDEYYSSISLWWQKRHNLSIHKDWIIPSTGVVAGISAIINTLVNPDDEIIIQTPAYNHFFNVIKGCRCTVVENDLIYQNNAYNIDFDDLERKAASYKAKILLLCNPHNPVGRAWTGQELQKIASICSKHKVRIISDEIHSDLLSPGKNHNSLLSVTGNEELRSIIVSSASKTFNLSGLHAAYILVNDFKLGKKIEHQLWSQGSGSPSLLACEAAIVSYNEGDQWVSELNIYLQENYTVLKKFVENELKTINVLPLEATYLVWLNCKNTGLSSKELSELLLNEEKLWLNPGDMYGATGEGFLRINIACPRTILLDGLNRLKTLIGNQQI